MSASRWRCQVCSEITGEDGKTKEIEKSKGGRNKAWVAQTATLPSQLQFTPVELFVMVKENYL